MSLIFNGKEYKMGIFDWLRRKQKEAASVAEPIKAMTVDNEDGHPKMPTFVYGYEIDKVVDCAKCHKEMYIPKTWVNTPRSAGQGPARDGNRCLACESYICSTCESALHLGEFKCCQEVVKGVTAICYFSSSDAAHSQRTELEEVRKGRPPIQVKAEEREEKRREWLEKAEELKEQSQYEKAFEYFDLIIRANLDTNGYVRSLKGGALIELGRYEEAAECLKEALKADPENGSYQFDLGRVLYELGHWEEARSNFEKVVRDSITYGLDEEAKEWLKKIQTKDKT
jgi:hypothetical protein